MRNILIGGGTGLIGMRLSQLLTEKGYTVFHLSREKNSSSPYKTFQWDVKNGDIDDEAVQSSDYVINLAGAGIADEKWTDKRKQLIISSRVNSTHLLRRAFMKRETPPKAYISASAIGYYGDRGEQLLHEHDVPGKGFLPDSCLLWEAAVADIASLGWRTVIFRNGIVLSTQGGALAKMLLPARMHLATYFGDGSQYYSWIHIDDLCRMYISAIEDEDMKGIYNGVGPQPLQNKVFATKLTEALGNSSLKIPAPAFALRLAMGEMADVILVSCKASSDKIENLGFTFLYPELEAAIRDLAGRRI